MTKFKNWFKINNTIISKIINRFTSIKTKLMVSFSLVIFILSVVAFLPLLLYSQPINQFNSMIQDTMYFNELIESTRGIVSQASIYSRTKNAECIKKYQSEIDKLNKNISKIVSNENIKIPKDRLNELINEIEYFNETSKRIFNDKSSNVIEDTEQVRNLGEQLVRDIKNVMLLEVKMNKQTGDAAEQLVVQVTIISLILIILISFICVVVAIVISKNISDPVSKVTEVADNVADGDLRDKTIQIDTKDEIKQLSESFTKMTYNLKDIISNVHVTSENVKKHSDLLRRGTTESTATSEEITSSAQQVTEGANKQFQIVSKVSEDIEKMYRTIEQLAEKISFTSTVSQEAMKVADDGTASIQKGITQIRSINTTISDSVEILNVLTQKSQEIEKTIELIKEIGQQTNLIAINASIEAAHAGEHGKGFAIVAQEIKKLADQALKGTKQINDTVENIQDITSNLSDSMNKGVEEIKSGVNIIEESGEVFEKIRSSNNKVDSYVKDNNEKIMEIFHLTANIKGSENDIIELSKSFTSSSEEVVSATEQLSASLEENMAAVNELNEMSEQLNHLVEKFKVE